jgi:SAM-dependent methyltransferase
MSVTSLETRFGASESAYSAYRPRYPDDLFQQVLNATPGPHERALDLGGGTGLSALPLTQWFNQVVVAEPDQQMAASLYQLSPKIVVREKGAEELDEAPSSFDLVTSGNAFYWMNGELVINKIATWLRSGGVLAVYRYGFPATPAPIQEILLAELKFHWDEFRHPRLIDEKYSERTVKSCRALTNARTVIVPNIVLLTAKQLVGFLESTSYCAAYVRTLPSPANYLAELEDRIRRVSGDSPIKVDFELELILAQKR